MTAPRPRKTPSQEVADVAATLATLRMQVESQEQLLRSFVIRALEAGERATDVASAAGVSRARIYQIRDGIR